MDNARARTRSRGGERGSWNADEADGRNAEHEAVECLLRSQHVEPAENLCS
jgi:hypothetical protein